MDSAEFLIFINSISLGNSPPSLVADLWYIYILSFLRLWTEFLNSCPAFNTHVLTQ